jgi:uncharacterized heparinase superfamily protein
MKPCEIARLLRTLHHLRLSQCYWRGVRSIQRRMGAKPRRRWSWSRPGLPPVCDDLPAVPTLNRFGSPNETTDLLAFGVLRHLNQQKSVRRERPDWHLGNVQEDRLWTIALHYHAWAYELAEAIVSSPSHAQEAAELLESYLTDWINRCRLGARGTEALAWNPYAVASRISWWIRSMARLGPERLGALGDLETQMRTSLWQQAAYLYDRIEWDLRANHLLRNAVGLAWAGRFFSGRRAERWLARATEIAAREADEQILSDGGHFERSPMYHLSVMEDLLALGLLVRDPRAHEILRQAWRRAAAFAVWMRHPDGQIPLLNDAALNGSCKPAVALDAGTHLGVRIETAHPRGGFHFPETGLVVWHGPSWSVFFDVGPIGPDYQPGHGHADTLTLECSLQGQRLFVDPGTHHYDPGESRVYDRSTAAHNTVTVDRLDSSEVWGLFRAGRRAEPFNVSAVLTDEGMEARASHSGYRHLHGEPTHTRTVFVREPGLLTIKDVVSGRSRHRLEGGFLLAPEWRAISAPSGWELARGDRPVARVTVTGPEELRLHNSRRPYHPEFGVERQTARLSWDIEDSPLPAEITIAVEVL